MEFFDVVKSRRSVRKYKSQQVEKEDILKILDAANWAPSAMNRQPWEFIVVSGEWIKRLGDSYKVIVEEFTRESDESGSIISNSDFVKFAAVYGGAPVVIAVLIPKYEAANDRKAYLESASAAMENLVLAAADLGLGTCWMTGPLLDESNLHSILQVAEDREFVAITPLGYPETTPEPLRRRDPELKEKVKWLE